MPALTETIILDALRQLKPNGGAQDIVTLGMVTGVMIQDARVSFALEIDPAQAEAMEPLRRKAEQAVAGLKGVESASAILTAHRKSAPDSAPKTREKMAFPNIKHIVAVASGKGGVGKSTTAANLAIAFSQIGLKTGLLDADIYGPSVPRLFHLAGKPQVGDDKKLVPMHQYGIAVMSMGFLIAEDAPMIWRGPMVHSAITQLFRDVAWGDLDILVVDLPPGTGDAQLTLAQSVPLAGAVIVSTPQDIALIDARKGLNMFRRVEVPVLGIIENMSFFLCPHCHERSDIFSHGGARDEAQKLDLPFLGEIPLDIAIRQTSDEGAPITHSQPDGKVAGLYRTIAERVRAGLS